MAEGGAKMFKRNRQKGFTLIELLIVVAIIGIIAAILIPNLLDALQKAKQKRTVADLRNTNTAVMSWLTDQVGAASAGAAGKTYPGTLLTQALTYEALFEYMHPTSTFFYMQEVPQNDGWGYQIVFAMNPNIVDSAVFIACSPARKGVAIGNCAQNWTVRAFISTDYDQDIVWADGYGVRYPG
jgi:prepilin-type N-terminal cleavage/methylation domain-containing protein